MPNDCSTDKVLTLGGGGAEKMRGRSRWGDPFCLAWLLLKDSEDVALEVDTG